MQYIVYNNKNQNMIEKGLYYAYIILIIWVTMTFTCIPLLRHHILFVTVYISYHQVLFHPSVLTLSALPLFYIRNSVCQYRNLVGQFLFLFPKLFYQQKILSNL